MGRLHLSAGSSSCNRRAFLLSSSALLSGAALAVWPTWQTERVYGSVRRRVQMADYPFQLGVASGDPAPESIVLWTRLAPDPLQGGGMPMENVAVRWQVSEDEQMSRVVRRGETVASPDWAHSVHVEVDGLRPDRWYWYQFEAAGETSPKGRTRTSPPADSTPQRLRFAFASCNHYEHGFFNAFEDMAQQPLDLVVHLGDYIYEGAATSRFVRQHVGGELQSLDDYRNRHAQYKTDSQLQALHHAFPWVITWDDHEFDNNYAADISEEAGVTATKFLERRAAAYKAYYEHMPLRKAGLPQGPHLQLYRRVPYGQLVQFQVLDTRQYRTDQPCGDGNKPPCPEALDPEATLLGAEQEKWLLNGLRQSPARWNVLAQQVMMGRVDRTPGEVVAYSMDQWPGYEVNRQRMMQFLADHQVANPVVLTGDIHTNWVNDLKLDFDNPDSPTVGTEFVGTSITSGGNGSQTRNDTEGVLAENPFVKFYNGERGYVSCEITPQQWQADYRVVEYVNKPGAPGQTRASFVVENGQPGAERA